MKEYLKEIKSEFPYVGIREITYLRNFKSSLQDSSSAQLTSDELIERFGEPKEIANQYFSDVDVSVFRKKISIRKKTIQILAIVALIVSAFMIKSYFSGKKSYIEREIIEIKDQGDKNE